MKFLKLFRFLLIFCWSFFVDSLASGSSAYETQQMQLSYFLKFYRMLTNISRKFLNFRKWEKMLIKMVINGYQKILQKTCLLIFSENFFIVHGSAPSTWTPMRRSPYKPSLVGLRFPQKLLPALVTSYFLNKIRLFSYNFIFFSFIFFALLRLFDLCNLANIRMGMSFTRGSSRRWNKNWIFCRWVNFLEISIKNTVQITETCENLQISHALRIQMGPRGLSTWYFQIFVTILSSPGRRLLQIPHQP